MELAGISNLNKVPVLTNPEHDDVKIILTLYSLESFLFRRLNQSSREQDTDAINTLGPFAVALTKTINHVQSNRTDGINGPFICYSGMALPLDIIEKWKKSSYIDIDGYRSASMKESTAIFFAAKAGMDDELHEVILRITF